MNKALRNLLLTGLLVVSVTALWWTMTREEPVPVRLYTVAPGRVEAVVANTRAGTVKACRRARLAPATGGQIAHLTVKEGDRVVEGQILVELWNADLAAQVTLAKSEATASEAIRKETCARAEQAQREADRSKRLRAKSMISVDDLDRAQTNAHAGKSACQAAKARIEVSAAKIAAAEATLDRTLLKAPFDGIVAEVNGELGEFVTPSPTGIATLPTVDLIDESCLFISAPIDEVDAPSVMAGMETRITLDAFSDQPCKGHVSRVAPYVLELEKQARTVEIETAFDHSDECMRLIPGYSADVEVILNAVDDVLRIPTDAIMEGHKVLVYQPSDGLLKEHTIETGISNWQWTEVESGLEAGDLLVTSLSTEGVEPGAYGEPEQPSSGSE